jgi:hypothetical protein
VEEPRRIVAAAPQLTEPGAQGRVGVVHATEDGQPQQSGLEGRLDRGLLRREAAVLTRRPQQRVAQVGAPAVAPGTAASQGQAAGEVVAPAGGRQQRLEDRLDVGHHRAPDLGVGPARARVGRRRIRRARPRDHRPPPGTPPAATASAPGDQCARSRGSDPPPEHQLDDPVVAAAAPRSSRDPGVAGRAPVLQHGERVASAPRNLLVARVGQGGGQGPGLVVTRD